MATQRMPIVGFVHVCMVNDYMDILKEQVQIMIDSGLYDAMSCVNICPVGETNLDKIKELIKDFSKLQLGKQSPNLEDYEFHTLAYMHSVCVNGTEFYGFYVHSKGISWPGHPGGKYWRDYMNHYVLRLWEDDVAHLDAGYDTCGVKLINKGWPMHYSGNFFWFKSLYAKDLIGVNRMNLKDRFNAEMWICSGKPIAATLCQDFVDYNTQGVFEPKYRIKI